VTVVRGTRLREGAAEVQQVRRFLQPSRDAPSGEINLRLQPILWPQ